MAGGVENVLLASGNVGAFSLASDDVRSVFIGL